MGHKDPYEHWVNDPFVPAEKKIEIYTSSMEKAMDEGRNYGLRGLQAYREVLAERWLGLKSEKILFALANTYIFFENLSEKDAWGAAEEFVHHHEWGEQ